MAMNRRRFILGLGAFAVHMAVPSRILSAGCLYDEGWQARSGTDLIVVHHTAGSVSCGPGCVRSFLVVRRFPGMV